MRNNSSLTQLPYEITVRKMNKKTRVLLIDVSRSFSAAVRENYAAHHPPLGLVTLGTSLLNSEIGKHVELSILDASVDCVDLSDLKKRMADFEPDVVGLRCLYNFTSLFDETASIAKSLPSRPLVIGGGPYSNGSISTVLANTPAIDLVCSGEGELTLQEVVQSLRTGKDVRDVPGIWFRENGKVTTRGQRGVISELDSLPVPNWELTHLYKYPLLPDAALKRPYVAIETSRGCPYRCTYCHELFQKKFRVRSADHILRELIYLESRGVRDIFVADDIFNLYPERVLELFNGIARKNLKMRFYFWNGLRGDRMTHEVIDAMVEGGTVLFCYALETATPRLQKLTKKFLDLEKFENAVHHTLSHRVAVDMFLMAGFPTETYEEALNTIEYVKRFRGLSLPLFSVVNAFPGTKLYDEMINNNRDFAEGDYQATGFALKRPQIIPGGLTADQIYRFRATLLRDVILQPENLKLALEYQRQHYTEEDLNNRYCRLIPGLKSLTDLEATVLSTRLPAQTSKFQDLSLATI